MADGHQVEGTKLFVLELLMYGFAYTSRFLLLRSPSLMGKLDDEKMSREVSRTPSKFGRTLKFQVELELDAATRDVYYVGFVADKHLAPKKNA